MASRHRISCINKTDRTSAHERISRIGGNAGSTRWTLSLNDAVAGIQNGTYAFFVNVNNREVDVIVARSVYGHFYLKTTNDGDQPNNLLSLPECP